jgi:ketosteroid isomerase-like protein
MSETAIRQRLDEAVSAIRARDIDRLMSLYATDIVSFDVGPPLRYGGADRKRRAWHDVFAAFTGPIDYELHEVSITAAGELAFVHSLNHISGTMANGGHTTMWVRWTACFQRIDDEWRVVHDHVSVPAKLRRGARPSISNRK